MYNFTILVGRFHQWHLIVERVHTIGSAVLLRLSDSFEFLHDLCRTAKGADVLHNFQSFSIVLWLFICRLSAGFRGFSHDRSAIPQFGEADLQSKSKWASLLFCLNCSNWWHVFIFQCRETCGAHPTGNRDYSGANYRRSAATCCVFSTHGANESELNRLPADFQSERDTPFCVKATIFDLCHVDCVPLSLCISHARLILVNYFTITAHIA